MKALLKQFLFTIIGLVVIANTNAQDTTEWVPLFNGKNLDGWKVGTNAKTFTVEDGTIKVDGPRAHLFYSGDLANHNFKNFEFKAKVMTKPGANSGIYFHTEYQEDGWPSKGYEVQVNNSQQDWKRTGSLYGIVDVKENYAADNQWYTEYIKVKDNRIIVKINGVVTVDYTQPENPKRGDGDKDRILRGGTFALQGHDPESVVFYKEIMVRLID